MTSLAALPGGSSTMRTVCLACSRSRPRKKKHWSMSRPYIPTGLDQLGKSLRRAPTVDPTRWVQAALQTTAPGIERRQGTASKVEMRPSKLYKMGNGAALVQGIVDQARHPEREENTRSIKQVYSYYGIFYCGFIGQAETTCERSGSLPEYTPTRTLRGKHNIGFPDHEAHTARAQRLRN
ncbi:hypothetical protein BDV95DRAFT_590362 [Massariosphaeria phaeospora]|uniref:Uncharacterized protein n=1 Tax=Massariosphaeria phaeospora TaxID=100035 RepID=A0A7C8MVQ6_9PLEO|nr:hypothetical protein BDV95DRAFT_590362 [Massariosphaeria phaeospora]